MWHNVGTVVEFARAPLTSERIGRVRVVVTYQDGRFGVISGVCNHAGGPLAEGRLDGEYVVCPWHNWKYHCRTGLDEPGFGAEERTLRLASLQFRACEGYYSKWRKR